ncbi:deoxyribodipyrimidine photo-lyase, partial [Pantoea sp. SIMBA_133]
SPLEIDSDPLPALPSLDNDPVDKRLWPAGEEAASDNLERFLRFRGRHYNQQRDFPSVRGTSELSPYLALGMISYRQCLQAVMSENGGHLADGD